MIRVDWPSYVGECWWWPWLLRLLSLLRLLRLLRSVTPGESLLLTRSWFLRTTDRSRQTLEWGAGPGSTTRWSWKRQRPEKCHDHNRPQPAESMKTSNRNCRWIEMKCGKIENKKESPFPYEAAEERKRALEREQLEQLAVRERRAEEVRAKRGGQWGLAGERGEQ